MADKDKKVRIPTVNSDKLRSFICDWSAAARWHAADLMEALEPMFRLAMGKSNHWPMAQPGQELTEMATRAAAKIIPSVSEVTFFNLTLRSDEMPRWLATSAVGKWRNSLSVVSREALWASVSQPSYVDYMQLALAAIAGSDAPLKDARDIFSPDGLAQRMARESLAMTRKGMCRDVLWDCLGEALKAIYFDDSLWEVAWEAMLCYTTAVAAGNGELGTEIFGPTVRLLPRAIPIGTSTDNQARCLVVSNWDPDFSPPDPFSN